MGINFTEEQQQVIRLRGSNILVAAAAGSGKTAVLVERIITRLTKDVPPLDVDQLLIVTFTEAAASEMKERIHLAIEKALEEQPDNEHLQRQATLIHQAKITTMHKFCLSVIREHFHTIGLDPGFRVAEEGEIKLLKRDVLEAVLEEAYEEATPEFLSFVESFAAGKDDKGLEELILQLQDFAESYPNPREWLDACVEQYEVHSLEELEEKCYIKEVVAELRTIFSDLKEQARFGIRICQSEDGPLAYEDALKSDYDFLESLEQTERFSLMYQKLQGVQWAKLGRNGKNVLEEKMNQVKSIRKEIKDLVSDVTERYFFEDMTEIQKDMGAAKQHVCVLTYLVKRFHEVFLLEKRKKNLIDFGDMEHYALQILTREENGALVPSEVAEGYQKKFEEIMIDEYQDSNYLQEAIMTSVSRILQGTYNIFMVGDVKQSIYRFRLSRPELFMEKFHSYKIGEGKQQRIDLYQNFRSRREVLDSTNFVFEQIMTPDFGGMEYDERAALHVGAVYEERPGNETELLIADLPDFKSDERMELEAELIVKKIQDIKKHHQVFDKDTGTYRNVKNSDIVILTRSPKSWNAVLSKVLEEAGIPSYTGSGEGYFQTQEIRLLLNYLRILDNPRQDLAFASILTSMFTGLDTEEMALLRSETTKRSLYECVLQYREDGLNEVLKGKLTKFLGLFEDFRKRVPYTAIDTLLWQIMEESGYGIYVSALPGGAQRSANVEMLLEKAVAFEGTSYKGLFNFVRYIEQLEKYEIDYGEADILDEKMDVVRLMSIHKSKGLEFPIVFVAGLGKQFNMQDQKSSVLIHPEWGIGIDCIDPSLRTKVPTILKEAIRQKTLREMLAEEVRILYVAMTRAKEKLILTAGISDLEKRMLSLMGLQYRQETQLPYYTLVQGKTFLDWIFPALCRNKCCEKLLEEYQMPVNFRHDLYQKDLPIVVKRSTFEDLMFAEAEAEAQEYFTREILSQWNTNMTYDEGMREQIELQFGYAYPYQNEQSVKQKLSVSELKKRLYEEMEGELAFEEEPVIPLLPKFLQEEETLRGASRGSAYHKFLELLDFTKDYDMESLKEELVCKQEQGLLTKEMAACIRSRDILSFLQSEIGRRVQSASRNGRCHMEQPFVLGLTARDVYPEQASEETILVQGIIDLYLEEDDGLVILDYKTDRVSEPEELTKRYQTQLHYYAKALERITGKTVKERIIYSFALGIEIPC